MLRREKGNKGLLYNSQNRIFIFVAIVGAAMESETHMAELKDLSAQSGCLATRVRDEELTRTHPEEEPDHGEMVDVEIDGAFSGMVKVQVVPKSRDKF